MASNECRLLQPPLAQSHPDPAYSPPSTTTWPTSSTFSSCDIQLGNDLLPFHRPISLNSGIVIDLRNSSQNVQTLAGINLPAGSPLPPIDIMYSPRGGV